MSFDKMKQNRDVAINKLVNAAEKTAGPTKSYGDDRMWSPAVDKAGNGYAVIRFLPAKEGEDLPWVKYWDHGFKGPTGRWYIENSLTSIGQPDPLGEYNAAKWNSGIESDKDGVRDRKRRLHYVSNILVISDPSNPNNEGKQFLYKFGKKIFDKIMDVMQPQFPGETPTNPFDLWSGANFKLKIRNVEGYRNYDKSEFDNVSELFGGDEERLKEVYEGIYSLSDFIDPSNYKSYDELRRKLYEVLGETTVVQSVGAVASEPTRSVVGRSAPEPVQESAAPSYVPSVDDGEEDGDDSSLSYFAKLAKS